MLVSFNLASNRPENFAALCENLQATAADPACLEVLVKIDDGDRAMHECVANERARRPFAIKALSTPGEGYFSLWKALNRLHRELCDPAVYFVCNINDEIRFKTHGWDIALSRYRGLFDDHVFRLKTSIYKLRNYGDFWECGFAPENYAFYTKRWLDVGGGDWNPCHGPDAFQQFVAYYLYWANYPAKEQFNRDVPIFDIAIEGEGVFKGLTSEQFWERVRKGWIAWYVLVGHAMQTEAKRRARMLQAYMVAHAAGHRGFEIADERQARRVHARDATGRMLADGNGRPIRYRYRLSWLRITLTNWLRRPMQNYYGGGGPEIWRETVLNIPFFFFPSLHSASSFRRNLKARLLHMRLRWPRPMAAGASNHVPHAPPALLADGTAEPWGSAETDADTYFWLSRRRWWRARALELLLFSPGGRAHLRDVRAVGRRTGADGAAGPWTWIPARIAAVGGQYADMVTVPPWEDSVRLRIDLDRRAVRKGRFTEIGLACLSGSRGDKRNWLDDGRGIYVREMNVVEDPPWRL